RELLRDRRAALERLSAQQILPGGTRDPVVVEGAVVPEAAVLDRDRRLRHPLDDVRERERLAVLAGRDRAEQRPVGGEDERVRAEIDRTEVLERAVGLDVTCGAVAAPDDPGDEHEQQDEEEDEDQRQAPRRLAASAPARNPAPRSAEDQLVVVPPLHPLSVAEEA